MSPGSSASDEGQAAEPAARSQSATTRAPAAGALHGRAHFQQQLMALELHALGGLDLIIEQLDRVLEALAHQDVELAEMVIADDDRVDGRYLEVHELGLEVRAAVRLLAVCAEDARGAAGVCSRAQALAATRTCR